MPTLKAMSVQLSNRHTVLRGTVIFATLLVLYTIISMSRRHAPSLTIFSSQPIHLQQPGVAQSEIHPFISNTSRMLEITTDNTDLVYLPAANMVFMTLAKGGTTSTWNWLYRGLTGRKTFNMTYCETYVQNIRSHCWENQAIYVFRLPEDEQWRVLTSDDTLRVAVQRDPFERIVSSFKSKFTCEDRVYGTNLRNRATMVPTLRRQAGFRAGAGCMNISEFSEALDAVRQKAGTPGHSLENLRQMDVHIRPQEFYFEEIDYDIVLDVIELSNVEYLEPIIKRLKYKDLVKDGIERRHASRGSQLMIPEEAAGKIYLFAQESKYGKRKYMTTK